MDKQELQTADQKVRTFFGCEAKAEHWLNSPKKGFAGRTPRELIDSGRSDEVIKLIFQAEHGFVF